MMYALLLNHLSDFILSKLWTCAKSFRNQANKLSIAKPFQELSTKFIKNIFTCIGNGLKKWDSQ